MVRCRDCDSENDPGEEYCHNCGAKLSGSSSNKRNNQTNRKEESGPHSSYYDFSANSSKKTKKGKRNKFAIAVILLFIFLIAFLIFSQGLINTSSISDDSSMPIDNSSIDNGSISLDNSSYYGEDKNNSSETSNYLKCPYCGSESVYESSGYYRCENCGETFSNPDNLEINSDASYSK